MPLILLSCLLPIVFNLIENSLFALSFLELLCFCFPVQDFLLLHLVFPSWRRELSGNYPCAGLKSVLWRNGDQGMHITCTCLQQDWVPRTVTGVPFEAKVSLSWFAVSIFVLISHATRITWREGRNYTFITKYFRNLNMFPVCVNYCFIYVLQMHDTYLHLSCFLICLPQMCLLISVCLHTMVHSSPCAI